MFATATHQGIFAKTYFYNSLKSLFIRLYNLFWYFVFIECFLVYWCVKGICYRDVTNIKLVKKTLKNLLIKLKLTFIKKEKFYKKVLFWVFKVLWIQIFKNFEHKFLPNHSLKLLNEWTPMLQFMSMLCGILQRTPFLLTHFRPILNPLKASEDQIYLQT